MDGKDCRPCLVRGSNLRSALLLCHLPAINEVIFELRENEVDGCFVAIALGRSISTQGDTIEELREMVHDAVHCNFGDAEAGPMPEIIRL
jgi:predicted RNase H-like HicB family nuclease